jgi:hypothetical protein
MVKFVAVRIGGMVIGYWILGIGYWVLAVSVSWFLILDPQSLIPDP